MMPARALVRTLPGSPDRTRARLLEAAERLFAERGFRATSVRALTSEARCNVASVNYHFGGKEVTTNRGLLPLFKCSALAMTRRVRLQVFSTV